MSYDLKNMTYRVLNLYNGKNKSARIINAAIIILIILNVAAVILETVKAVHLRYSTCFYRFEIFSVAVFTIEYLLRIWCCTESEKYRNSITGRLRYSLTPMAIIDITAILPFYLPVIFAMDLRFIRAIRLLRIFRLFKIGRYSKSLEMLVNVARAKRPELFIALFVLVILLIISSSFMYFIEHEVQPEQFSSIPAAMWWGVSTLTTVGYGDIYPVTHSGKFLGALISIIGIGLFALPAGILASGLIDEMHNQNKGGGESLKKCPHCGRKL